MARRKFSSETKTKAVLEVLREEKQLGEVAQNYGVSPNQLRNWKKDFLDNATRVFDESKREQDIRKREKEMEQERNALYRTIGQVTFERDFLKKKVGKSGEMNSLTITPENPESLKREWLAGEGRGVFGNMFARLTTTLQCTLLGIPRTSIYRKPSDRDTEREERIKARLDYWHTMMPYLGVRKLRDKLRQDDIELAKESKEPMKAGRKLIAKYMKEMGIYAVYPKPNLSRRNKEHKIYPYLLRNMQISFPNQVWAVDITYIKMSHGHMYLTAIIDWHSRYIVGWALSDTLDTAPVLEALKDAVATYGVPAIASSDQGSQFTSDGYTSCLKKLGIRQSMDGKARWVDNVIIERWFRSFKTEWLYVNEITSPRGLRTGITEYVREYNELRPHQTHGYATPEAVFATPFAEAA